MPNRDGNQEWDQYKDFADEVKKNIDKEFCETKDQFLREGAKLLISGMLLSTLAIETKFEKRSIALKAQKLVKTFLNSVKLLPNDVQTILKRTLTV